jgi:PAS domain S-box-containing protein
LAVTSALGTVLLAGWVLSLQVFRERAETLVIERTAALRESDQRFHLANRAVFNVIWDQNLPAGDIWWNENLQVVYGYPPEAIANGDMWRHCIHPQDLERVLAGVTTAVDSGAELWADSYRFRRADGTYAFVDDRALIVRDKSGRPVRMIGAMHDITARKQAEESLRQQQQELQLILDSVPALIFYKDRQHRLIRVNQEAVRVTGLTREQIEGKNDREMGRELAADYYRDEDEVMATGIAKCGIIEQLETPFGLRWMQTDKLPYRNAQGEIVGVIGFAVDITQRLQAEREREQLEAQLRQVQKMEAIGNLSGGIAHDFNNILGAILGNAELARQDVGVGHPALESINDLIKAGTRAKNLVSQILTFAREQPRDRHITALPPLIEESLHLLEVTLPANVTLVKSIAKDLPNVLADATQIQQLMLNLGTNAGHALQGEAGMITVTLTAVTVDESLKHQHQDLRLGRYVALSVADTGIGMDAKLLGRIFDPFFTTKPPGQGTGLGLSVVHGIMKTLNGVVTVKSQPGKGTTFTLFFPTVDEPVDAIPQPPDAPILGHGQRILYLDDDVQVVTVTAHTLERLGYHVTSHTSPPEALTDFRTNPQQFDLVITDYNMPEMTGLDVAAELLRIRPALPVIISSGYLTEELTMKAHAIGVQGVISKPTSVDEFSHLIYQSIEKSKIS